MAQIILKDPKDTEAVVKRVIFNLWKATGGPTGMGFLRDNPGATEDQVFEQAVGELDYPGRRGGKPGEVHMDYVFGRCLKTQVKFNEAEGRVEISPDTPRPTYQDWGRKYNSAEEALLDSAIELGANIQ